ncbi:MAG: enoyl-CoA hydratase/isomerase family protein [Bacteroidales bacterium]|nr:enoyl-CoA hydratase/isomerase family protein [Bacteroidales bacterium]
MESPNSTDSYDVIFQDELAIITFKARMFEFITDISESNRLLRFMDELSYNSMTKALLLFNEQDSFSPEQYDLYLSGIMDQNAVRDDCQPPYFSEKNARFRMINILNTFIRHMVRLHVPVIAALRSKVVTPFVGAALAADLRYATADTVFCMAHNRYGLHPSGGLPFFLSSYLHHSKAIEIQMTEEITAEEALQLGLINEILPAENFREMVMQRVRKLTRWKYCTIRETKRLTHFTRQSLDDYFTYEASLLNL